ncbi:hypothetical protein CBR_g30600 [Chara braunii]|uniref:Uncharacterized protein n=1 Tax=Chara braunii TaxID=69332 RepID=A0A388LD45_CHABU|nr:hypothetical protein CBR_g30600 [Chara braunii]|eukprot:GBG80235.1 hypothetical protein CBR_g30600 [Chara braunii]
MGYLQAQLELLLKPLLKYIARIALLQGARSLDSLLLLKKAKEGVLLPSYCYARYLLANGVKDYIKIYSYYLGNGV